jgi:nicotinamide mononucleotide (NMN) deamidase PncC
MLVQAERMEAGAIKSSTWHTASAAFDVAGPEGSAGLEDCGESPCLACARQAIFERASEWQGRRSPE